MPKTWCYVKNGNHFDSYYFYCCDECYEQYHVVKIGPSARIKKKEIQCGNCKKSLTLEYSSILSGIMEDLPGTWVRLVVFDNAYRSYTSYTQSYFCSIECLEKYYRMKQEELLKNTNIRSLINAMVAMKTLFVSCPIIDY